MVNIGGPSKGCITCIRRKIRCDRQRPICAQCNKAKRSCGGYRDTEELMFRDHTQDTIARVQAGLQRQTVSKKQPTSGGQAGRSHVNVDLSTIQFIADLLPLARPPTPDQEDRFIDFFGNNFTCSGPAETPTNIMWVPNNFRNMLGNECARLSATSLGAVALARLHRSTELHRQAQKNYSTALLSLANFWRNHPEEVDKDYALFAVLFLGSFEIFASYDPSIQSRSWETHLGGLGILFQRRGQEFVNTDSGARVLMQSRVQAIVIAIQAKQPVADTFRGWSLPAKFKTADDVDQLLMRLADLQAEVNSSGPSLALIAELTTLDEDLRTWMSSVPPSYAMPSREPTRPSGLWWDVRYDVYPVLVASDVWNRVRVARIIIHELIEDLCLWAMTTGIDYNVPNPVTADLRWMATDVCSAVPLCYRPSSTNPSSFAASKSHPPLGLVYWLVWPLQVVGCMRGAPLDLIRWLQQCLETMHEMHGIVLAQVFADRLKQQYEDRLRVDRELEENVVYEVV